MAVSVIIPSHNEGANIAKTVRNVLSTPPGAPLTEVVVIDDHSTDSSVEQVASHPTVRCIRPANRLGVSGARNFGAHETSGEHIIWIDAHTTLEDGWAGRLVALLKDPKVGACSPGILDLDPKASAGGFGCTWVPGLPSLPRAWIPADESDCPVEVPFLPGGCIAMRREVFKITGGFDEGMILHGEEDIEVSLRLWLLGYTCLVDSGTIVRHLFRDELTFDHYHAHYVHNKLRVAALHFDEDRLSLVIDSARQTPHFPEACALLLTSSVAHRRMELLRAGTRNIDWFIRKFGLEINAT
ncbi:glycosyltransferase [Streptomyces sp. NPDC088775]|uniref:glycosyltransferase n=1 Tax=Streptomyces sp. NPDC088775 TaxID=3365896 RepID=UPI00382B25A6